MSPPNSHGERARGLTNAVWERHKRGYLFVAVLLLGIATLFKRNGWLVVILVYAILLGCLETLYRAVRSLVNKNKNTWWAKPRPEIPRADAVLAVMIVFLLVGSRLARSWLVATLLGALVVGAIIHLHRTYEETD